MRIHGFGLELTSLSEKDLKLVHYWRNQPEIQSAMLFQNSISFEEHKNWFDQLTSTDKYLIIRKDDNPIGVVNVKNIDPSIKEGEAGVFIGEKGFTHTTVPVAAVLLIMTTFFEEFHFSRLIATVRKDNPNALEMNENLGYEIVAEHPNFYIMHVEKDAFNSSTGTLRRFLSKQFGSKMTIDLNQDEHWLKDEGNV